MIVGVDVSSHRIDLAYLDEKDRPCRWHQILEGDHLIDRLRSIRMYWPGRTHPGPGEDVTDIAIEYPFGRSRTSVAALMATVGVITSQAPFYARVAWPSSGELRAAIGARNTKDSATQALVDWALANTPPGSLNNYNEHERDALVACIGWTRILEAQDAA